MNTVTVQLTLRRGQHGGWLASTNALVADDLLDAVSALGDRILTPGCTGEVSVTVQVTQPVYVGATW